MRSIRQAVDETGAVVAYYEFDPCGNLVVGEGGTYIYELGDLLVHDYFLVKLGIIYMTVAQVISDL